MTTNVAALRPDHDSLMLCPEAASSCSHRLAVSQMPTVSLLTMQALLTEDSAAFVADYPSGTFRGLPAYEKHQRAAMKWASRLLQHQLVEPDGPMEVAGNAATAPWEFEYTVIELSRMSVRRQWRRTFTAHCRTTAGQDTHAVRACCQLRAVR